MAKFLCTAVRRLRENPRPCLLCGTCDTTTGVGLVSVSALEPSDAVPPQRRLIAYRLCVGCMALPESFDKVEARLSSLRSDN